MYALRSLPDKEPVSFLVERFDGDAPSGLDNQGGVFSECFFEATAYRTALLFWDEFES